MVIHRILVPTDFPIGAESALSEAVELASVLGAEVDVLHVLEPPLHVAANPTLLSGQALAEVTAAVRQRLEELVQRSSGRGVRMHALMNEGSPAREIVRAAEGRDLIVMSTHGRTGLAHTLVGSVAERVVRTSPIPVLTIRGPAGPL